MHWKGRNINQCMGNTEHFLRRGGINFAVAVHLSQLHVEETLVVTAPVELVEAEVTLVSWRWMDQPDTGIHSQPPRPQIGGVLA